MIEEWLEKMTDGNGNNFSAAAEMGDPRTIHSPANRVKIN